MQQSEEFFESLDFEEFDCPKDIQESTIWLFSRQYKIRTGRHFHDPTAYIAELRETFSPISFAWIQVPNGTREEACKKLQEMLLHAHKLSNTQGYIPGNSLAYDNLYGYVVFEGEFSGEDFSIEKYTTGCINLEQTPEKHSYIQKILKPFRSRKKGR